MHLDQLRQQTLLAYEKGIDARYAPDKDLARTLLRMSQLTEMEYRYRALKEIPQL